MTTKNVMITGGAGFIGSHLVRKINEIHPEWNITVVDKLTYAGTLGNIKGSKCEFFCIDIVDREVLFSALKDLKIDIIFHLAAESHVDRSIENPLEFVTTNVIGTVNLLDLGRHYHQTNEKFLFYHVSTDEVFGSLGFGNERFNEDTPYAPHSPYSASKASSDHFVRAYHDTYKLPVVISNCSNNYGTHQYPEKLIPVVIRSLFEGKAIGVYGEGINVRDWLHVEDHAEAILKIAESGNIGRTYCIGGDTEMMNIEIVKLIKKIYEEEFGKTTSNIVNVSDRLGHDLRYAIDHELLTFHTGWKPKRNIEDGLRETIKWYHEFFTTYKINEQTVEEDRS